MPTTEELLLRKRELLQRKKKQLEWQRSLFSQKDRYNDSAALTSSVFQGLTQNFGDEALALGSGIEAAIKTPGTLPQRKEAFDIARESSMVADEIRRNALREQYPGTTFGGEALGGVVSGGALFKGLSPLLKNVGPLPRMAGAGAVEGAIFGAGSSPDNRLGGAAVGVGFGAATGPFLVGAGTATMKALRPAARRLGEGLFGKPRDRAVKEIIAALDAEDLTTDEAFVLLRSLGRNATFADLGDTLARQGRIVTSELGPSASKAKRFLDARQLTQQRQLRSVARRATGTNDYDSGIIEIINNAESKAGPIYDEVYSEVLDVTPVMIDLLKRPAIKKARRKAEQILRNEGFATDIVNDVTDVRYMDAIKRALDDQIGTASRTGNYNQSRVLTGLKRDFVGELDRQVPRYAEARSVFAGEQAIKEAAENGRTMLVGNKSSRDIIESINGMGESELRAARIGFLDWLTDELSKTSVKRNTVATKFTDVPKYKEVITELFPDQQAVDSFLKEAAKQVRFNQTKNLVTGGSPTARIQSDRATMDLGLVETALNSTSPQGMLSTALRLVKGNTKLTPDVLEEMGKILFDPKIINVGPKALRPNPFMLPFTIPTASPSTAAGMGGGFAGSTMPEGLLNALREQGLIGE